MTFEDIFKSSFIENVNSVSLIDMGIVLLLAFAIGLFIFYVYKRTYAGVMFSSSIALTLIAITMITSILILAVTSNVVLSLGMVGALSIVRFRTAIKEPSDIAFLFWSIAVGIILAAGLIPLSLFGSLLIGAVLVYFSSNDTFNQPYILVLHCLDTASEKETFDYIKSNVEKLSLKSKSVSKDLIELNYEIRLSNSNTDFINTLSDMKGVNHVVMVSYNGDYMS